MIGWILLLTFLGAWSGFGYWSRRVKKWSPTISIGGGFIVGCLALVVIGLIVLQKPGNPIESGEGTQDLESEIMDEKEVQTGPIISSQRKTEEFGSKAISQVKNSDCEQGGTVHVCFLQKISIPAVTDLGWTVRKVEDGFVVQKEIKFQGLRSSTVYLWHVSPSGSIEASNGHAITISGQ